MNHLYRSPDDRIVGGVAGGMAETYDFDPALVRVGWAFLILVSGGLFLLLYIVMVMVVPLRPSQPTMWSPTAPAAQVGPDGQPGPVPPPGPYASDPWTAPPAQGFGSPIDYRFRRHRRDGSGALVLGILLIAVGGFFLIRQYVPTLDWDAIWPVVVMGGGALLIVAAFSRPQHQP